MSPTFRRRVLIGLAATVFGVAGSSSAVASPTTTVTFGIVAAAGPDDARTSLTYRLAPGASITDRVAVVNYSDQALPVRVYGADATGTGAEYTLAAANATPTGVGAWLTLRGQRSTIVVVPARRRARDGARAPGRSDLTISLSVAPGAKPGSHAGGIAASLDSAGSAGVTLQQRVALRVYVDVAAGAPTAAAARQLDSRVAPNDHSSDSVLVGAAAVALLILVCLAVWRGRRLVLARRKIR